MTAATRIDELTATRDTAAERVRDHNERVRREAEERFAALGGCGTCRGRGWVVTWDTLDCMQGSYAEYDSCGEEACTPATREASGYHPTNLKYDRNRSSVWYPPAHEEAHREQLVRASERANAELYDEVERWTPAAGKLVEVVKAGGGKKAFRVPVGTIGLVKRVFTNDWGTAKAVVVTEEGAKHFPAFKLLAVVDPEPDTSPWDQQEAAARKRDGVPMIVMVKRVTPKAALVTLVGAQEEHWVPLSQVPELGKAQVGKATSAYFPVWLAREKGFPIPGSSTPV